jgi:hypothetical protein
MNADPTSLDRLHDIIVPGPVPWWPPPAPGWYWMMAFALVVLVAVLLKGFIRWQRNRYRREALAELARQEAALRNPELRAPALLALSELLKRTALTVFPREQVATLTGPEWFAFLDGTAKGLDFRGALGPMLENAIYDPRTAATLQEAKLRELVHAVRRWIREHKTGIEWKEAGATKSGPTDQPLLPSLPSVQKPC